MKTHTILRNAFLMSAAALLAAGCGTTKATGPTGPGTTTQGPAKANEPQPISTRAKVLFEDAVASFDAQKKAKAYDWGSLERKFKAALDVDANLAEADYNLGVIAERQGKLDEAKAHYLTALKKKPSLRQASENLAVMAQNAGDIPGAVKLYQDVLQRYPDDAASRARLAEIYRQTGDHDRAMQFARAALMRDPQSTTALKVMMRSYVDRKQLSMAKLVALRAMKLDQTDPELYTTIGLILLTEDNKVDALLQFKRAVEVREDFVPAHVQLARIDLEQENYPSAEAHLRRILQTDGKNAAAHLNLGVAYKGQGQYDKAMQEYDEAEKLDPNLAAIYLNRAIILHKNKNAPERAVEFYKKYISLSGGEVALKADAPVFALLRDAESTVNAMEEAKRAEEQAKKLEALQKEQEAQLKAEEEKQKQQQGGNAATPATGTQAPAQATPTSGAAPGAAAPAPAPAAAQPAAEPAAKKGTDAKKAPEKKNAAPADNGEPKDDLF